MQENAINTAQTVAHAAKDTKILFWNWRIHGSLRVYGKVSHAFLRFDFFFNEFMQLMQMQIKHAGSIL